MEDTEMHDQAAHCHREIALIYGEQGNQLMERRAMLKAAHMFFEAALNRKKMHLTASSELELLMETCFLEAIEKMLKQGSHQLAGYTFVEMAIQFEVLGEYDKSFAFLIRASRFFPHGDIYALMNILNKMVDLIPNQANLENAMTELQTLWNSFPKTQIGNSVQILLLNIETRIFLLQLIQYQPNIPQLLYDGHWQNVHGKSVAMKEEFQTLAKFLLLIRENNYLEAYQLYTLKLQMLLDPKGKTLSADKTQLDEILRSNELDEKQKMLAMFEFARAAAGKMGKLKL